MIILLRAFKDGKVVHAETYDHDEKPVDGRHPAERCRCIPDPLWRSRAHILAASGLYDHVTSDQIYRSK